MAKQEKKLSNPLEFVLDFEIAGATEYLSLAKRTKNVLGKQLFYSLAKQEIEHAKKADELYHVLQGGKEIEVTIGKSLQAVQADLKAFFNKAKKFNLRENADDISGYELAMELERKGYKAYSDFLKEVKNDIEKKFFEFLLKEEAGHIESLMNVQAYLTSTGDWFEGDESKIWNWMNL